MQFHPDSNPGDEDASQKFKQAAEAYEVLSDSEKRGLYDRYGHAGVDSAGGGFHNAEDIFAAFGEIFGGGGIFDDFFGGRRGRRQRRGSDVRADVELTLEEAAAGVHKTVHFHRNEKCETCDGQGSRPGSQPETCRQCGGQGQVIQSAGILRMQTTCPMCRGRGNVITDPCDDCRGNGFIASKVELEVAIPAGVDDGMRVRLSGEGEASPDGGPNGDCYCFIKVKRHKIFHRDGTNLILELPVAYTQAVLGAAIDVPTLNGPAELKIPGGTQSGEIFRLKNKGMPDPQTGRTGDMLVQTFIETPKKLSSRQEELLRDLAELEQIDVSPKRRNFFDKIKDYFAVEESQEES